MKIGVLAIQGSVIEHKNALIKAAKNLKIKIFEVIEVRLPEDLLDANGKLKIQGIILPGGESTTQLKLLKRYGLFELLRKAILGEAPFKKKLPVWGTCAGAILLAKEVKGNLQNFTDDDLVSLAVMDISADRNAYGTQIDSFSAEIDIDLHLVGTKNRSHRKIEAVFIRAPKLSILRGHTIPTPKMLAARNNEQIAIMQGSMLATSFHPELTDSTTLHEFFLETCHAEPKFASSLQESDLDKPGLQCYNQPLFTQ